MCGIAGLINLNHKFSGAEVESIAREMLAGLFHRGPDSHGKSLACGNRVMLVHTRLSIMDLSAAGHQPMQSDSGLVLTFNGEIYNHKSIKQKLNREIPDIIWNGHSDTEVLLNAIVYWGLDTALNLLEGMFAFAVCNDQTNEVVLVRDRFGEKPLYYIQKNDMFAFGSELKAIVFGLENTRDLDKSALEELVKDGCVSSPGSIFSEIKKLQPGMVMKVKFDNTSEIECHQYAYWSASDVAQKYYRSSVLSFDEAVNKLDKLLTASIEDRLEADVPIGCLLSGGIDSSLITAITKKVSQQKIRTFTAGFDQADFDESVHAKHISDFLGTDHTTLKIKSKDLIATVEGIAEKQDEPFADGSFIPTWLISECTKKHVDVVLTGDGGDELFCGYSRYFRGQKIFNRNSKIPSLARRLTQQINNSKGGKSYVFRDLLASATKFRLVSVPVAERLLKYIDILAVNNSEEFCLQTNGAKHVFGSPLQLSESNSCRMPKPTYPDLTSILDIYRLTDTENYLPEDILVKTDRCGMGHALEARLPFLDTAIYEFCWSVPIEYHIKNDEGKQLLKALLDRYIPHALWDRPKKGFGAPIGDWLKDELREWTDKRLAYINQNELQLFNVSIVNGYWNDHLSGKINRQSHLWPILVLAAWLENHV